MNPYCFVITSFGEKENLNDLKSKFSEGKKGPVQKIDFDKIYEELVKPAILNAGLEPLIEREEKSFGSIHKTMYEKIILCEFCIADLTNFNPNAYYELGMRYAVKPFTTIPIIASSHFPLPFDIGPNRTFAYQVDSDFNLSDKENDINTLTDILLNAKKTRSTDSPLYDMINGIAFQNSVAHEKTDVFRDKVKYNDEIKKELAYARNLKDQALDEDKDEDKIRALRISAINSIIENLKPLENIETAVLIDIMISFRDIDAFNEMQAFIEQLPNYVFKSVMVQEQYAFILNRNGSKRQDEVMIQQAETILHDLETEGKASSESYGIWGRIYKDKFDRSYKAGNIGEAKFHLKNALKYYEKGFESDPRDAYPGVNYVTCLELLGEKERALRLLPAVEYAVKAKMKRKPIDYWDYASLLELAIIENKYDEAEEFFYQAKPFARKGWMFGTTRGNLEKILDFRKDRNVNTDELENFMKLYQ